MGARTRWSFPRIAGGPWGRPLRPFPHISWSPSGLAVRDFPHLWGSPSGRTRSTRLRGIPSGRIRLPHLRWTPSGGTGRGFPHLRRGCFCRGYVLPRRWPGSATYPTGLGPSVLLISLFLVASTTDVTFSLGPLHQYVHWHIRGVMFAHICANLPAQSLHKATFHLSFRVNITTQAT